MARREKYSLQASRVNADGVLAGATTVPNVAINPFPRPRCFGLQAVHNLGFYYTSFSGDFQCVSISSAAAKPPFSGL